MIPQPDDRRFAAAILGIELQRRQEAETESNLAAVVLQTLRGSVWHTTNSERYKGISLEGAILPEPDNKQIKSLGVFDAARQAEIEKILQIQHLYAHQNGLVDDRFREYFPAANLNDEYLMTLDEFLTRWECLAQAIDAVDEARAVTISWRLIPEDKGRSPRAGGLSQLKGSIGGRGTGVQRIRRP